MEPLGFRKKKKEPLFLLFLLNRKTVPCVDRISDITESVLSKSMNLFGYLEYVWMQSSFIKSLVEWLVRGMEKS